jgi:hypothetical protein
LDCFIECRHSYLTHFFSSTILVSRELRSTIAKMAAKNSLLDGSESPEDMSSLSSTSYPSTPVNEIISDTALEKVALPPSPPAAGDRDVQKEAVVHARSYQTEMLQESLKQNIIVAVRLDIT